jgi:hypothetical protein
MKKIINKVINFISKNSTYIFFILVLISGFFASRTLFKNNQYWIMHDDLQMMRQLEMEKCFKDGQIPCRWVPDMGYGFGFPLFNYYPPLPYLFGQIFRTFTLTFNLSVKLTFALGIILSGITMYILAKEFFGKWGGLISSVFYVWAPYRAVDVFVRGAMNESWAWIFFPLSLWSVYKIIKEKSNWSFILLSVSLLGLLLSHNLMAMIFSPVFAVWTIYWLVKEKSIKSIFKIFFSGLLTLGLAAFFTLPAVFEQKYVHIGTLVEDYFAYAGHFVTLNQLFISRFWGDGPSIFGSADGMAFPIGYMHWIIAIIALLLLAIRIIKKKKFDTTNFVILFALGVGIFAAFMSHNKSAYIWRTIAYLKFVQFPWRFLSLNVFGFSFAAGGIYYLLDKFELFKKDIIKIIISICILLSVIGINWNYFKPVRIGSLTDEQKFSGEAWRIQQQAGIRDYLPINAKKDPNSKRINLVDIVKGKGSISNEKWGTNWSSFNTDLVDKENSLRINIYDYPIWRIFVDGKEVKIYIDQNEEWGRIYFNIPEGKHGVYLKLYDTTLRKISNYISLISLIILIYLISKEVLNRKKVKKT